MNTESPGAWGILPHQAKEIIGRREWTKTATLKARLTGVKPFPIRLGLKPPSGSAALRDMTHFSKFIAEWKSYPYQDFIQWTSKSFRNLAEQRIPSFVVLSSISDLILFLGASALSRSKQWENNMMPLLQIDHNLYTALVKRLESVERLNHYEAELLAVMIPQMLPGMGKGLYLRALPLVGVDTKFLESHLVLVEEILNTLHKGDVAGCGGLVSWLQCQPVPKDWLTIRPLCPTTTKQLGNIPLLKMDSFSLRRYELPGSNILVVENVQSGLALPELENTVAVVGGGRNIGWMDAGWLHNKRVAYWGDIDTWGLSILSDVRRKGVLVEPLMMDVQTVLDHEQRMVMEPQPVKSCPPSLTPEEEKLYHDLISGRFLASRLEQERLSADYIRDKLVAWLSGMY